MIHPHTVTIRQHICDFMDSQDEPLLNEHAHAGQWSMAQVLEHLYLMETAITARMGSVLQQNEPTPPPLSQHSDAPSFRLTPDRSRRIEAPAGLVPADKHMTRQELHTRLSRSRSHLEELLQTADPQQMQQKTMNHPVFGSMTLEEWVEFIGLHEQRHLEQMKEIQSALTAAHG